MPHLSVFAAKLIHLSRQARGTEDLPVLKFPPILSLASVYDWSIDGWMSGFGVNAAGLTIFKT